MKALSHGEATCAWTKLPVDLQQGLAVLAGGTHASAVIEIVLTEVPLGSD